jgi:hypothetical protein
MKVVPSDNEIRSRLLIIKRDWKFSGRRVRRWLPSGVQYRVVWQILTDVSEELSTALNTDSLIVTVHSSETSFSIYQTTRSTFQTTAFFINRKFRNWDFCEEQQQRQQ